MRLQASGLIGLVAAVLIVVVVVILDSKLSYTTQQSVQTTSTARVDSIRTFDTVQQSSSSDVDSTQRANVQSGPAPATASHDTAGLIIPVVGVTAGQLVDTYTQARSNGRVHDAIDIMAPHNSPVIAAASGQIVRLFQSRLGGTTIYELSPDGHTVYYYAHLDHYADGVAQGEQVQQGQVLGYVGDTGDAGPGNYHLHFAIWLIQDPKKFWDGQNINPYPILRQVK